MQRDMEELKARQTDVLRRVEREEEAKSMQRLAEVNVWLKNVDNVSRQVSYLLSNRTTELQRLCSKKSRSNYGYGKRVSLVLKKVNDLNSKGVFEVVAEPATETSTKEKRLFRSRPDIVGRETILKRALSLLVSGETGSICLYGVGGVGKSNILREIRNKITARFEFVIWVVVSQHLHVKKIQEEIGKKLGFHGEEWNQKEESQKANEDRRFALLLDDCLAENDAWDLFQMKVGGHASCSKIQETAREVSGRCHGLPLALNVLGETMSCKKKVREWNDALHVLNSSPRIEFAEKEDEILSILKYSYDSLKDGKLKSCFQYCALFPAANNRGYENIDTRVRAGLLMESDDSTKFVQMHDVVRKMALWVASDLGKNREEWVVEAGVGLRDMVPVQDWTGVRKMSLMNNEIEEISGGHECHQLTTLFLQQNSNLISRLFALRYLNLSRTKIERLPDSLGKLKRLEHLNLETTKRLKSIYGLLNASSLGVLALLDSNVSLDASTIEELQRFERLERDLQSDEACLVLPTTMMQLRKLIIKRCGVLEIDIGRASYDTFLIHPKLGSLSSVTITGCNGLKHYKKTAVF
ncbi:hypothetical protein F2Q69_00044267 [Brassica cretica]|uniref:NB-ARC domain-containing protein n=1 Tax=Brassica cretica TaxID=69181 RepID=A0A8S9NFR6_BRACR|nr:hypothetical protein F2Q69_00044267 [Brassica cretica]